jgi:hypothetical protein
MKEKKVRALSSKEIVRPNTTRQGVVVPLDGTSVVNRYMFQKMYFVIDFKEKFEAEINPKFI